jgi:spoIIIJ-associated protein
MSSFQRQTEKRAKSVNEATELALKELGVKEDEAEITVIDEGSKGFLGIGSKEACVRAKVKNVPESCARKFLNDTFRAMGMEVDISIAQNGDMMNIELSGEHMGILIGKRGDTLDSIQYLTSLVVNQETEEYMKVSVDTENYRSKRTAALEQLAARLEKKVEKSGRKYTLEPMNPYERRVIHAALQDSDSVTTYSVGTDPYRKVVVALKRK